jgi:hypothetical protein
MSDATMDSIRIHRDRRLRRRLLGTLYAVRGEPSGGLGGRVLITVADGMMSQDGRFQNERHAMTLLRDLEGRGYVSLQDTRKHPRMETYGLDYLTVRITSKGVDLVDENVPVDPAVEDDRDA